jgi:HPt (histidine-containing phosphotransfer) domain-containing protein
VKLETDPRPARAEGSPARLRDSRGLYGKDEETMGVEENSQVLDRTLALASVGGDREFLSEVAGLVQAAWPTLLGDIRHALAAGDLGAVERTTRLVKAAARNVSAARAYGSALRLEAAARAGQLEAARAGGVQLEQEVEKLKAALATLGKSACFSTR